MRHFLLVAAWGVLLSSTGQLAAALNDEIITEAAAQRYGLTRMWITQAQVSRGQSRLQALVLCDGRLYAQSNRASLEAIDAETGQKLWSKMVGQASEPSLSPGAFRDLVATINGCTLFVLNRYTGDILYQTVVNGAPGAGPALSAKRAYVPMVDGTILAYRLDPVADAAKELGKIDLRATEMSEEERKEVAENAEKERRENIRLRQDTVLPLSCGSTGRALVPPLVTTQNRQEEFVAWVTDRGYLYVGRIDRHLEDSFVAKYRLHTNGNFSNPPAFLPPNRKVTGDSGVIFAGSSDGYVYAVVENGGDLLWKFATSDPVIDSPVAIIDRVYATTELGGMFCLDTKTGKQLWWAPEVLHFVAAGKQRVYAADKLGRLRILDARNGALLDSLPTTSVPIKISNGQTDRIYLASEGGMIQCLREVELTNPVVYQGIHKPTPDEDLPKPPPKLTSKSGEGAVRKPPREHVAPKKPVAKKDKADAAGLDDAALDAPKPAKGKAGGAKTKPAKGKKADADADANPFGGN